MEKLNMKEKKNYEVIKKWAEGLISYKSAKLKLGYSEQHMYRLKKLYKEKGKDGFIHGNRGRKPKTTIDQSLSNNIVQYYTKEFQGFNFKHYQKMLKIVKDIDVSYSKIYNELTIKNDILSPKANKDTRKKYKKLELLKKRKYKDTEEKEIDKIVTRQIALEDATPRIPKSRYPGENVEIDASSFVFFGNEKAHLHLSIDTANNECTGAYLDRQETLNGYYHVLYQILTNYGIPIKLTSDGRTIFEYLSKKMKSDEKAYFTQFKHCCNTLGIELSITSKSQKKPRVERYNSVFQDRLSHELHYYNITTIEDANEYLINKFIPPYNEDFAIKIDKKDYVYEKIIDIKALNFILAVLSIRKFNAGNSISYKNKIYLPYNEENELVCYRKGTECTVIETFDKKLYTQIYGEIFILKELQERLEENEDLSDYYEKMKSGNKNTLPNPQGNWDSDTLDEIFGDINEEYNIYDSHNPKL